MTFDVILIRKIVLDPLWHPPIKASFDYFISAWTGWTGNSPADVWYQKRNRINVRSRRGDHHHHSPPIKRQTNRNNHLPIQGRYGAFRVVSRVSIYRFDTSNLDVTTGFLSSFSIRPDSAVVAEYPMVGYTLHTHNYIITMSPLFDLRRGEKQFPSACTILILSLLVGAD